MIGCCDICDRQNVPVSVGAPCGIDTSACFICQGEDDPDPYGELDVPDYLRPLLDKENES